MNISNLNINETKLVELSKKNKKNSKLIFKLKKRKNNYNLAKKVFYNLFNDDTKNMLINYEKSITKTYKKIRKSSKWYLIDRNTFIYKKADGSVCSAKKHYYDFLPVSNSKDINYEEELSFCVKYIFRLKELAMDLDSQEGFIRYSLKNNLKEEKDYNFALELGYCLGLIDKEKNKTKELIK